MNPDKSGAADGAGRTGQVTLSVCRAFASWLPASAPAPCCRASRAPSYATVSVHRLIAFAW